MKKLFTVIIMILVSNLTKAQYLSMDLPMEGKPCPDFVLNDVEHFSKKQVSLNDFKGHWLILDFWNEYCSKCLSSFPKIDSLQKIFAGKVKFLLVGYTGSQYLKTRSNERIRKLYEKNRKRGNLELSIAYDSVLVHRYQIRPTPYLIIIDPQGIVRGITTAVSAENINDLMAGKRVSLKRAYRGGERLREKVANGIK